MSSKVNASHGPTTLTLSGSTGTTELGKWIRFGPIKGTLLGGRAVFTATSAGSIANLQGILAGTTSPSTALAIGAAGVLDLLTFNSSLSSQMLGANTGIFSYVRVASSALGRSSGFSESVTVHFGAIS